MDSLLPCYSRSVCAPPHHSGITSVVLFHQRRLQRCTIKGSEVQSRIRGGEKMGGGRRLAKKCFALVTIFFILNGPHAPYLCACRSAHLPCCPPTPGSSTGSPTQRSTARLRATDSTRRCVSSAVLCQFSCPPPPLQDYTSLGHLIVAFVSTMYRLLYLARLRRWSRLISSPVSPCFV